MWWRAAKNLKVALAAGMDPLKLVIDRAHEKDIQVIANLRINDASTPDGPNRYMLNRLKVEHPEYMIGEEDPDRPRVATCLNFAIDEVRQERLDVIEEVCDRYGADGIEINDYVRVFFKPSEIERHTPLLTDFVRSVRELLNRIGEKRGKRLMLATRSHPREDANLSVGMDVRSWIGEKLVDAVVVDNDSFDLDPEAHYGWLVDAAEKNDVWVYPRLGRLPYDDRHHKPPIEMYRAVATNQMAAGAAGIYLAPPAVASRPRRVSHHARTGRPGHLRAQEQVLLPGTRGPEHRAVAGGVPPAENSGTRRAGKGAVHRRRRAGCRPQRWAS